MFTAIDFVVFGLFLLLSILVGLYHGIRASFQKDHSKTSEYLTGGRKLPIFPVCLSLLTTFISGIALLAGPSEIYLRGYAMGMSTLTGVLGFIFIAIFFIPMFYKLKFLNAYEYFEMRFDSPILRRIGTIMFMINTLIYMAIVVYSPAVALSGVDHSMPLWPFVVAVGLVSTLYTAMGGIKAVIWTDSLQAFFLYIGLAVLLIKGTMDAGGFFKVIEVSEMTGRLTKAMARFSPSLLQYHSFWIAQYGGVLHHICVFGLNQMALQRYCSMPSLRDAKIVMMLTIPASFLISLMTGYIGLLMVAYFNGCDPLSLGEVKTSDQMPILLASRVLSGLPGLPGVFLATLFSATLSTVSSGINSMTAVLWEDFLKVPLRGLDDKSAELLMKIITVLFGVLSTVMAFGCHNMGGIFHVAITFLGASTGPLVGLFFLGIFFPKANKYGAYAGFLSAMIIMISISYQNNVDKPYQDYVLTRPTNETSQGCVNYQEPHKSYTLALQDQYFANHSPEIHFGREGTSWVARISPYAYASLGVGLTIVIGIVVSYLVPQKMDSAKRRFAFACTYQGLNIEIDKSTYYNSSSHRTLEDEKKEAAR
ncbi:sodium:solute symporter family domain-containing protein [Ditylenchus destructor]|nr:sodium:solute symporter family domain-containing protein [Ditylenchus destructor]